MNALKHMEVIFAAVLVVGCVLALMPPRQATPRASMATPMPLPAPMPVVVITGKRPAPAPAKHAAQPTESPVTTAAR
ncbi:MAG: hypothetical protein ABIT83_07595 [Massilia sp.]